MTTLDRLMTWTQERLTAARVDAPRLDAELLLGRALGLSREALWAEPGRNLSPEEAERCRALVVRREAREPMAYILGEREFWSLAFKVTRDVLIPRPETEQLLEALLARIPADRRKQPWRVLELCTGSGALAVAAATELPQAQITATDLSLVALNIARLNAERHGVEERIDWIRSDLYAALKDAGCAPGSFDFIVCNPPYLTAAERAALPPEIRNFEPAPALDGGPDGLAFYPRLVTGARDALAPGGWLLLEIGCAQGEAVRHCFDTAAGFENVAVLKDYSGRDRVAAAQRSLMNG